MSDAATIGLFLLAGLYMAVRWIVWTSLFDAAERLDRSTWLGVAVLVGMAVLGIVIVAGLRDGSAYN